MKKLYLVDVSNMFFRAYYAIPPLSNSQGLPTNALYGFLAMTIKLLRDINPDYLVYCFDRKEPSFRSELYDQYKANRSEMPEDLVPQMPYIRQLTQLLGIKDIDSVGYEADDVIGTLTVMGRTQGLEVVIVSGDKDFAQLVDPHVMLYDTMKNAKYDVQGVIEKWGIEPKQVVDYLALIGDSSDNIPGVRGVGPKGAQKLLAAYKNLEGVFENVEEVSGKSLKEKLKTGKDDAYLAQKLVKIVTDIDLGVTIEDLKLQAINKVELNAILEELDFQSFAKKLLNNKSVDSKNGDGSSEKTNVQKPNSKKATSTKKNNSTSVSVGASPLKSATWTVAELNKSVEPYSEVWAVVNERGLCLGVGDTAVQVEASAAEIGSALDNKKLRWRGFDLKKVWNDLQLKDPGQPATDLMLSAYVIRAGNVDSFDKVHEKYLGKLPPDLAGPADILNSSIELNESLNKKLDELAGHSVLEEIELPLVPVLYQMEKQGIRLDTDLLKDQSVLLEKDIAVLEKKVFEAAGTTFNVASTKQLGEVLFNQMGIPPVKKTKTGYSTDSEVLNKLAAEHPICEFVIEFRELSKLKSTYVDALPQLVNPETGKIHTQLRQAVTSTGRLSSVNPNLQNIPIRTERGREVRRAFVAEPGHQLLSIDYSQIELRVLAEISGDKGLIDAFENNLDIHAATASEVFAVPLEDVTPDLRRMAKAVNFGIAYGQGPFGLAESLGISRKEGKEIIDNYFKRFKKVKSYMEDVVDLAKNQGYVETLFGRRRYLDELKSGSNTLRKFGERAAINAPIQGTASDLVKKAMITVADEVSVPMILQVHDELLFQCPENELEDQAQEVKEIMESVGEMQVPLVVNAAWGANWEDAHQ